MGMRKNKPLGMVRLAVRNLNRLENVAETLRAALNAVATVASDWLLSWVPNEWFERYGRAVDEYRLPKGIEARYSLAETIGNDGMQLLISIYESSTTPQWLRQIPAIEILRQTWLHQYYIDYTDVPLDTTGKLRWRNAADLPKAGDRFDSPYDTDARYANKRSTTSESEPRKLRLRPEEEHQIIQTIRSAQDTDEWKERYNTRAGVEGTLSQGINAFGLRQARYRNLPKVRLQHIITAVAINVVRTVSWLDGIPHAATRISRFAALAAT
jgi:Transposase DDE domain